ncbi:porin [Chitinibacter sp. SCUT-21]|uniref:porin n=1 Tax=Chitinibacter sp. SCUT-21 TaxID=2970891 RepID=UPI0035A61CAF
MFKRVLIAAAVAAAVSAPAFADVSITGSAEMDLFYRTNNTADGDGKLLEEVAIVINFNGSEKLDSGNTLKWKVAQKIATDYRFDSFGKREAWIGYQGGWGELRFGNQFTNSYLTMDWPYGVKGTGNLWADFGAFENTWADSISYFSPNFGGFSFTAQYKLGAQATGVGSGDGYDLTAGFGVAGFNFDLGYQYNNDRLVGTWAAGANDSVSGSKDAPGANSQLIHAGVRGSFGDFGFRAAYKNNAWENAAGQEADFDQYLAGVSFSGFTLSYQYKDRLKAAGVEYNNEIQQVAFQWDTQLGKNTWAGVQVRHQMIDNPSQTALPGWALDGWNGKDDNVTRALVYTWTAF